jgi:hypothetical protein
VAALGREGRGSTVTAGKGLSVTVPWPDSSGQATSDRLLPSDNRRRGRNGPGRAGGGGEGGRRPGLPIRRHPGPKPRYPGYRPDPDCRGKRDEGSSGGEHTQPRRGLVLKRITFRRALRHPQYFPRVAKYFGMLQIEAGGGPPSRAAGSGGSAA